MFTGVYTEQQTYVINEVKCNRNVLLSTPHATGKSLLFSNMATAFEDLYYSIGRTDYNLDDLRRQYQNEDQDECKSTTLFLDNVLVNDINKFKQNLTCLHAHLRNIHVIAYFKNPEKVQRYFPRQIQLSIYFAHADQLRLTNLTKSEFRPLSDTISAYNGIPPTRITKANEEDWTYDRHDKIVDNHTPYDYSLEGKFPKLYCHGPCPTLNYNPTLIIRVNDLEEKIDENLLKATEKLIILKRKPNNQSTHPYIQQRIREQTRTGINLINPHNTVQKL